MATIDTRFDETQELTLHTVTGEFHRDEVLAAIQAANARRSSRHVLWDFSRADVRSLNAQALQGVVEALQDGRTHPGIDRVALVVATDLGFGLGRMYTSYQELADSPVQRQVFRDRAEALGWLLAGQA